MDTTIFFNYHLKKYPAMQREDKIKLIYQGILGPRHLYSIPDPMYVKISIQEEASKQINAYETLYEWLSPQYLRIHLRPYLQAGLDITYLIEHFLSSSQENRPISVYHQALALYMEKIQPIWYEESPHHSTIYHSAYHPCYRVVHRDILTFEMRLIQLQDFLRHQRPQSIIALEGRCASGKTTLCQALENTYTVLHMDDFFLPIIRKTKERLNEVGGNIDYELVLESLLQIKKAYQNHQKKVTLKTFCCTTQTYHNREIELKDCVIVEGVYAFHPYFRAQFDHFIYIEIDQDTQFMRIKRRKRALDYFNVWMPLEEIYYKHIDVYAISDIII
ncbi:MAG: deoxynucleoside kinase [Anaeroplasma bactoclasticum]|nr:deoxynucleoside kinase [Anaeroplasma bactoclasticum]